MTQSIFFCRTQTVHRCRLRLSQEAEGLRLLKETVPLLEDASLSKSIGYYHLGCCPRDALGLNQRFT